MSRKRSKREAWPRHRLFNRFTKMRKSKCRYETMQRKIWNKKKRWRIAVPYSLTWRDTTTTSYLLTAQVLKMKAKSNRCSTNPRGSSRCKRRSSWKRRSWRKIWGSSLWIWVHLDTPDTQRKITAKWLWRNQTKRAFNRACPKIKLTKTLHLLTQVRYWAKSSWIRTMNILGCCASTNIKSSTEIVRKTNFSSSSLGMKDTTQRLISLTSKSSSTWVCSTTKMANPWISMTYWSSYT